MELGIFCQQNAASSTGQTERDVGSVFTAEIVRGSHVCVGHLQSAIYWHKVPLLPASLRQMK